MVSEVTFTLVCEGCGTFELEELEDGREMVILKDMKEHVCNHLGNAELLRDIHEHKTNHRPYIRTEVDGNEHVPEWAEGGWRDPPKGLST